MEDRDHLYPTFFDVCAALAMHAILSSNPHLDRNTVAKKAEAIADAMEVMAHERE